MTRPHPRPPRTGSTRRWRRLRRLVLDRDQWRCYRCGRHATHADHIVPYAEGGRDEPANLRAACAGCNLSRAGRAATERSGTIGRRVWPGAI